jgi:uncharacterized integral membrane protein
MTRIFYWLIFLMAVGVAIFAIQNSSAPPVTLTFIMWHLETSLIYTLLGSFGLGAIFALFFWVPRAIRTSLQMRELKKENKNLEEMLFKPAPRGTGGKTHQEG